MLGKRKDVPQAKDLEDNDDVPERIKTSEAYFLGDTIAGQMKPRRIFNEKKVPVKQPLLLAKFFLFFSSIFGSLKSGEIHSGKEPTGYLPANVSDFAKLRQRNRENIVNIQIADDHQLRSLYNKTLNIYGTLSNQYVGDFTFTFLTLLQSDLIKVVDTIAHSTGKNDPELTLII
jgi:hypothetical protein